MGGACGTSRDKISACSVLVGQSEVSIRVKVIGVYGMIILK